MSAGMLDAGFLDRLRFIFEDEEIMSYIHEKEKSLEQFNGEPLPWRKHIGYSVREVFEAHKKVCSYLGQDGLDYSDFTEIEIIEWVEQVLAENPDYTTEDDSDDAD